MQHVADALPGDRTCAVKGPHPAILAGLAAGNPQNGAALPAEIVARSRVCCRFVPACALKAYSSSQIACRFRRGELVSFTARRHYTDVAGGMVDQELKKLMKELGEAINHSVAESDEISEVMSRIKAGGYDVFLVLEATIGFNQRDDAGEHAAPSKDYNSSGELEITSQDVKFLRSLRIAGGRRS